MIARCQTVNACAQQFLCRPFSDSYPAGSILTVSDHEVQTEFLPQRRKPLLDGMSPRTTNDVANEQNPNRLRHFRKLLSAR
jgi:hypothetical protein